MWRFNGAWRANGTRLMMHDWLSSVVPDWLAEVMRPQKVAVPWEAMVRAVLALWVPMAAGFATGRRDLGLLPAMGGLLSIMIDSGGPFWPRVERIGAAAIFGGAPGLLIGTLIHGRGWIAVGAVVFIAGVSAIIARLGAIGSVTGLQLFIYSALGLGPLGTLRPWWHTALGFLVGVAWALLLITPGYLISPRSAERKAVAEVYYALARGLRLIGTPDVAGARMAIVAALNTAYDAMLTRRSHASGRSRRDTNLMAVLNVSQQFAEAAAALRATGERLPPLIPNTVERLADAILDDRGPGSGMLGLGGRHARRGSDGATVPLIPPPWSTSPGALALREAMVSLTRVLAGNWTVPPFPPVPGDAARLRTRVRARLAHVAEQLIGGRIAWEFTIRLVICTGIAAILSQALPVTRSYWLVLTVVIIMKPDYGSVFARAVQRGVGTVVGALLGTVILAIVPYGPWLLAPFGILAALQPYGKARNFGLSATFLTPLVVLFIDLLDQTGWHLALARLEDTLLACAVVLLVGYAPWPSAWQANLPTQFAEAVRAVSTYADDALVTIWEGGTAAPDNPRSTGSFGAAEDRQKLGAQASWQSPLRRRAYRALSNVRAEFQRTMSEPTAVSRRAAGWWPAVVGLEELIDAVTACDVEIGRGAPPPSPAAVHALTGALRAVADAIETETPPRVSGQLPTDPELEPVTDAVRAVLSVFTRGKGGQERASEADGKPAPAPAH